VLSIFPVAQSRARGGPPYRTAPQNLRALAGLPAVLAMGLQTTPLASYLALMRGQGVEIHPGANFCTKM